MLGSGILEVAIGVIFIYLLVSLLCSSVREGIESWTKTRAAYLEYGIRELLMDRKGVGLARSLFEHPLIFGLYSGGYAPGGEKRPGLLAHGNHLPSYIPARSFATALLDLIARGPGSPADAEGAAPPAPSLAAPSLAALRANVLRFDSPVMQRVLLGAIDNARGDLDKAQAAIEAWYDSSMERVGGWYKRSSQWIILWIALAITVGGNFNTIRIADYLYHNDAARAALVERSKLALADPDYLKRSHEQAQAELRDMHLPIGWGTPQGGMGSSIAVALVGWLMTAFAATLGAPFWFDVLRKVMVVRGTLKPDDDGAARRAAAAAPAPVAPVAAAPLVPALAPRSAQRAVIDAEALAAALALLVGRDAQNDVDACSALGRASHEETPDDQLPVATGGVAEA